VQQCPMTCRFADDVEALEKSREDGEVLAARVAEELIAKCSELAWGPPEAVTPWRYRHA